MSSSKEILAYARKDDNTRQSTQLDFLTGYQGNLAGTGIDITQAESAAAVGGSAAQILAATCIKDAVNTWAATAAAAVDVYLPPAVRGDHLVLDVTGDMDEANACTIRCVGAVGAASNVYGKQVVGVNTGGIAGSAVETLGTAAAPTSVNLIYTPAAANTNFLGIGSMIHFYCPKDNQWLVNCRAVPEGTGATGAFTTT